MLNPWSLTRKRLCRNLKKVGINYLLLIDKQNYLRLSEWFTIQNELSVLAQKQSEMKRLNREQRLLKKRIRNKEDQYNEIAKSRLVDSDYNY